MSVGQDQFSLFRSFDNRHASADPAQVAREVHSGCLLGELADKTRCLVTNQLQFVSSSDFVLFMHEGRIVEVGFPRLPRVWGHTIRIMYTYDLVEN